MILKRFYDDKLAQASYLIGSAAAGEALVVDPSRDAAQYIAAAEAEGLRITHVTETHIHADFVSGTRELAAHTGARIHLSDEGGPDWRYAFADGDGAVLLEDGDTFRIGEIEIEAVHTPGHTPEHLSFVVTDTAAADGPMAILTGDFVFVGDVGRPDLLERAAKVEGTMEAGARALFRSLRRFREYPDWLQVLPGHGAGSACGKGIGSVPSSTVGYERRYNWAFAVDDEEAFVRAALAGQPEPPRYFAEMKRINRDGPRVLGEFGRPARIPDERIEALLDEGEWVVDTRAADDFVDGYIPGTINIPLNRSFTTWAGWLIPFDRDFHLIVDEDDPARLDEAVRDLAMIGLDRVAGWFGHSALRAWARSKGGLAATPRIDVATLAERMRKGDVEVLDVRGAAEWQAGHLPDVDNIPVGFLQDRLDELPRDRPLVLHCQGGGRSAIAASLLRARGFQNVTDVRGGYGAWRKEGFPTQAEDDLDR